MSDSAVKVTKSTKTDELSSASKNLPRKIKKLAKFRFLSETNFHELSRESIYKYIVSLHSRIRKLLKKCKKYKQKLTKLVSCEV